VPQIPGFEFQLQSHAGKVKALAICWLVYAGLAVVSGIVGLRFAHLFLMGPFSPWTHPNHDFGMSVPFLLHFAWITIVIRAVMALAAGWGLWERTAWGRILAIVCAFLNIIKFPFGTALGIWTLVLLLGYRNSTLYEQGQQR
jgi:hypothetical protein